MRQSKSLLTKDGYITIGSSSLYPNAKSNSNRMTLPFSGAVKESYYEQSKEENLPEHDSRQVWFLSCPVDGPFAAVCSSFISHLKPLFVQWCGKVWLVTKKCYTILKGSPKYPLHSQQVCKEEEKKCDSWDNSFREGQSAQNTICLYLVNGKKTPARA